MNSLTVLTHSYSTYFLIFFSIFFSTLIGVYIYRNIAIKARILANPNFRTLHKDPIPSGGGIVFSCIFLIGIMLLWSQKLISNNLSIILVIGGFVSSFFGFLDDKNDIKASIKLIVQILLSSFSLFYLNGGPLTNIGLIPDFVTIPLSIFFLVWVMNAYNFMDGIDGMASLGAIFSSGTIILVMLLTNELSGMTILFCLISICLMAFIIFNWPPAKIFMGDAGSVFLGYVFGTLVLYTTMHNQLSIWTWIIVFGYFIADIVVTQIARLFLVKKWYLGHRSHAYQNFARLSKSHLIVNMYVSFYYLFWLIPLAIWSNVDPNIAMYAAILAITPASIFSYKYGPVLSSK